jgi:hypothetical protein
VKDGVLHIGQRFWAHSPTYDYVEPFVCEALCTDEEHFDKLIFVVAGGRVFLPSNCYLSEFEATSVAYGRVSASIRACEESLAPLIATREEYASRLADLRAQQPKENVA